jgi:hypothetical protein
MIPPSSFADIEAVARSFIKPCREQPASCEIKLCSDCCAAREDNNLFFMSIRKSI